MDWDKHLEDVNNRENDCRVQADECESELGLSLSYTGIWTDYGHKFYSGTIVDHGDLWYFTSRYKYISALANIPNYDGVCLGEQNAKPLERCLELGCDWGHCFDVLECFFEKVYGIEAMQSAARAGIATGKNITHGLMEHTPYEDNFFDVIISRHVLEHGLSPDITLREIYRITKPGGWSIHALPCRMDQIVESESIIHKSNLNYKQWLVEFQKAGFTVARDHFSWNHNQEEWNILAQKVVQND